MHTKNPGEGYWFYCLPFANLDFFYFKVGKSYQFKRATEASAAESKGMPL